LIAKKIEEAIPMSLSKGMSGTLVAEAMLTIHTAVKAYIQASSRPSQMVLKTFEPLDLAIKSAKQNIKPNPTTVFQLFRTLKRTGSTK
jgi:hypothetical protein